MARVKVYFREHSDDDAVFVLVRNPDPTKQATLFLRERFRYKEPVPGGREFVVPLDPEHWETDLASIPSLATWLVPKDGSHTPAALVHDAMVTKPGEGKCYIGPDVTRQEADAIFRQGMQYLGVPLLRRWMMWAAVSLATFSTGGRGPARAARVAFVGAFVVAFGGLGLLQTLDAADVQHAPALPWMGARPYFHEALATVAADAVALVVGILAWGAWRKGLWKVGLVGGAGLLLFAFPMVVAGLSYLVYVVAEALLYLVLSRRREARTEEKPVNPPWFLKEPRG